MGPKNKTARHEGAPPIPTRAKNYDFGVGAGAGAVEVEFLVVLFLW